MRFSIPLHWLLLCCLPLPAAVAADSPVLPTDPPGPAVRAQPGTLHLPGGGRVAFAPKREASERKGDAFVFKKDPASSLLELARERNVAAVDVYTEGQNPARCGIPPFSQLHNWNNHPGRFGRRLYAETILRGFE